MRAIFIRHGQSTGNADIPCHDLSAIALTELGHDQAREVAAGWRETPVLIVTSPYLRTQQTAAPTIARFPGVPVATRLTLHILAAVAEHEREMISARTKAALAMAKARGVKLGNSRPAPARERAAATHRGRADRFAGTVRDTIGGMAAQGMSLRAIARELDRRGVPTARGGVWQAVQVRAVLARSEPSHHATSS